MNWYERWFGEEYLLVYEHRDVREAEREIEALQPLLNIRENELILDLCCGPGRHDIPLAFMDCRIIGLDYSMPMLKLAMDSRPLDKTYPLYIRGDVKNIPFRDEAFDVVLNLFTSFGYFSDKENIEILQSIARILKPAGRYVIDYLNPHRVVSDLVPESTRELEGLKITEKRRIDPHSSRIEKTIHLQWDEHTQMFYESVRLYKKEEMVEMLCDAGLYVENVLGSVDGSEYDETSDRMILYGYKESK